MRLAVDDEILVKNTGEMASVTKINRFGKASQIGYRVTGRTVDEVTSPSNIEILTKAQYPRTGRRRGIWILSLVLLTLVSFWVLDAYVPLSDWPVWGLLTMLIAYGASMFTVWIFTKPRVRV